MKPPLMLTQISKRYGSNVALAPLTAELRWGQRTALVGANGGGKSTLIKILAGSLSPDEGGSLGNRVFTTAWMPDRLTFSRNWTASDWLNLQAEWKKVSRSRVDNVLREAGLFDAASRPLEGFSQGMLRRLLYAQTRLAPADLVLLDEPEGGLDPVWMQYLDQELVRLSLDGQTVVFSTHLIDLAVMRADEIWVFAGGRRLAAESTDVWKPLSSEQRRERLIQLMETP